MKFKLIKASKALNLLLSSHHLPHPYSHGFLFLTSTHLLLLPSGKPYHDPINLHSSLKPSSNAASLFYEDFVPSSIVTFGTLYLIISASLSSPVRLWILQGTDWITSLFIHSPTKIVGLLSPWNTDDIQHMSEKMNDVFKNSKSRRKMQWDKKN